MNFISILLELNFDSLVTSKSWKKAQSINLIPILIQDYFRICVFLLLLLEILRTQHKNNQLITL